MKLLVGYGNTLRRDDGVGCWLVQQLAPEYPAVKAITAHQLLPEIAAEVAQVAGVIFVDAAIDGDPGSVRTQKLAPLTHLQDAHALTPAGVLHLCGYLYDTQPTAHLITVTGCDFALGEGFSPAVEAALPHALSEIRRLLG